LRFRPNKSRGSVSRFVHAGNVLVLVERTLFEAKLQDKTSRNRSFTSVQTGGLLLAESESVNPEPPKSAHRGRLAAMRGMQRNFVSCAIHPAE
jgi:hypothetical protein